MKRMFVDFMTKLGAARPESRAMLESAVAYLESLDATDADGITGALENLKRTLFDLQKKADDMGVWHVVAPAVDDAVKLVVKLDEKS